jgi:integrase
VLRTLLEAFRREHGDKPLARLERDHVRNIIGAKAGTPEAANNLLKTLRLLLNYAVDIGILAANPAIGVKRFKSRGEGFHTWSETEVAQFEAAYPIGTQERLALALLLYTAQRVADVGRMGWQHLRSDRIAVRQQKTDAPLLLPIHPELARSLASVPRNNLTFIVTEHGAAFSAAGLSNWFGKACRTAGLVHCTAHGLREAACRRLAEAGATVHEIAAISGHKSLKEIQRYTEAVDQAACRAGFRPTAEGGTRTRIVQPRNPVGQNGRKRLRNQWHVREMKTRQGFLPAGLHRSRPRSRRYIRGRKLGREQPYRPQ